ncbi:MAG TPA: hypothetical protein VHJ78_13205, partial [Actinomycetota bacterium]|nr:hypothetical protein [Actinomycetota bacterium]
AGPCRSRIIGRLVAVSLYNSASVEPASLEVHPEAGSKSGATPSCASATGLQIGEPSAAGRIMARFLSGYRVSAAALVVDSGARAAAFAAGFRESGLVPDARTFTSEQLAEAKAWAPDVVLVAGDRSVAEQVVAATAGGAWTPMRGVFLAPWLLDPPLLESAMSNLGPQFTIGLDFDPHGKTAQRYLRAMRRFAPLEVPTSEGLAAFVEASDRLNERQSSAQPVLRFFSPSRVSIWPAELQHHVARHLWLESGGLAAVSVPVSNPAPGRAMLPAGAGAVAEEPLR